MNLISNGNFVGGLIGNQTNTQTEIKNNLYIGNIVNKKKQSIQESYLEYTSYKHLTIHLMKTKLMV